jgi:hypothetical protein
VSVQGMHKTDVATGQDTARHRADRSPELVPHVRPSRYAHLDRRRRRAVLRSAVVLVAVVVLTSVVVGSWRLFDDAGAGRGDVVTGPDPTATAATRSGVAIQPDGDVQVSIDVVRSSTTGTPTLRVPERAQFDPEVRIGSLLADAVQLPLGGTLRTHAALQVPAAAGASRLTLDLTATGTYAASAPSAPGRGLVLLTPLHLAGAGESGRLEVTDPRILNLACQSGEILRACGSRDGATWVVEDLGAEDDVLAQVDLFRSS